MNNSEKKILVVFDFDHTILIENSDIVILKLLTDMALDKLSPKREVSENWANFMQEVYKEMKIENISIDQIKEIVENMEFNPGFLELFEFLKHNKNYFETLIISGANTLFVEWVLQKNNLSDLFPKFYSNVAEKCDQNVIKIRPYHIHDCVSCDESQCKRIILNEYLELQKANSISYSNLIFVGDGLNDYCPATFFEEGDMIFPRYEFPLYKKLFVRGFKDKLKCQVHTWKDGHGIVEVIKKLI